MNARLFRRFVLLLTALFLLPALVYAGGGVRVGVGIGIGPGFYRPYPYYPYPYGYYPYYAPPPVYLVPGPTYVQGPPTYVQAPGGYVQTVPSQQNYAPPPTYSNAVPATSAAANAQYHSAPQYLPPPPQPGATMQPSNPNAPPPYPVPSGS
ncbi:MAG TPA: hypothetical protein VGJ04_10165 [Pirellulales bacterium]